MAGGRPSTPAPERFFVRVAWSDERFNGTRCLLWTGSGTTNGYGRFAERTIARRAQRVASHRWLYERWIGAIPAGMQLDHLCRRRACVNPFHLEVVTCAENVRRGVGPTARNGRKTHCKHGHPFDDANTIQRPGGGRACRACRVEKGRARRALVSP